MPQIRSRYDLNTANVACEPIVSGANATIINSAGAYLDVTAGVDYPVVVFGTIEIGPRTDDRRYRLHGTETVSDPVVSLVIRVQTRTARS